LQTRKGGGRNFLKVRGDTGRKAFMGARETPEVGREERKNERGEGANISRKNKKKGG